MVRNIIVGSLVFAVVNTAFVGASANPETNKASYWGANCVKTEMSGEVMTYTAPSGTVKVIVKGGTGYKVYENGSFVNLTAPINPNNNKPYGISHVIACKGTTPAPEQPKPEQPKPEKPKSEQPKPETKPTKPVETKKPAVLGVETKKEAPKAEKLPEVIAQTGADESMVPYVTAVLGLVTYAGTRLLNRR